MTIILTPMQTEEFRSYLTYTTKHYAEEKVKAGTWRPEDALRLSKQTFLIFFRKVWKHSITMYGALR